MACCRWLPALALAGARGGLALAVRPARLPNGLVELRLQPPLQATNAAQVAGLEAAVGGARSAAGILILTSSSEASGCKPQSDLAVVSVDERRALAMREHAVHNCLRDIAQTRPVIAIGDGCHPSASSSSIFMAASTRVCTERTVLSLPECRGGLIPGSGSSIYLSRHLQPHLHMYVALTGAQLNPHDCVHLDLATHYVHSSELVWLMDELRRAPAEHLDLVVARRALEPPDRLASLFVSDVQQLLDASLLKVFSSHSAAEMRSELEAERQRLGELLASCGWQTRHGPLFPRLLHNFLKTYYSYPHHSLAAFHPAVDSRPRAFTHRERAEAVLDVLDSAANALSRTNPEVVAAMFRAVRQSRERAFSEDAVWDLELSIQCKLAERLSTIESS